MRILHVSDLHLGEPLGIASGPILERFYAIVAANARTQGFNLAVVTGDIRKHTSGISVDGAIDVIDRIAASAKLLDKRLIHIVPGNHDISRGQSKRIEKIRKSYDYCNGTFDDAKSDLPFMLGRFDDFFWKLCEQYYHDADPWRGRNLNPHYLRVYDGCAFVFVNSSLSCIDRSHDEGLIVGTAYLKILIDKAAGMNCKRVVFFAHHPIQNLANPEETALNALLMSYSGLRFYWMCGDAHKNRRCSKEYIQMYQVGSLTIVKEWIPDFAVYDLGDNVIDRMVFRFLGHLNNPAKPGKSEGGWKHVYIDPKPPSPHYDETLE